MSNHELSFPALYDKLTKGVTLASCVLILGIVVITRSIPISILMIGMVLLGYAFSPQRYSISTDSLLIHRLFSTIRIPLDSIRHVQASSISELRPIIRLWGSGGLFGYYGLFRASGVGVSSWYVTDRNKMLVIRTAAKNILVSPEDPAAFLSALQASVKAPLTGPRPSDIPAGSSRPWIILVAVMSVLAVAGLIVAAISYSPGPPRYTLTPASITIHDRFYSVTVESSSVDIDQVRVVDFTVDREWRPTLRTNGFANSHYRSGWFRTAGGKSVRLYSTGSQRLVLLPPKGPSAPVLLEVARPYEFVDELRRTWPRH